MAKKIRLDFTKVEERSGWNTRAIPEGLHGMKIVGVQDTEAGDGTRMLVYALVPESAKYKTRRFPFYCKLQQNQLWKLRDLAVAAGVKISKSVVNFDPDSVVGKVVAAEVEDETGQYAGRSSVNAVYGTDILDGEDEPGDEDDEYAEEEGDEEEYEAEDDEDDDGDDDEEEDEVDEDELREELEALTLPKLRNRAKGLGIDHEGVKKVDLIELVIEEELGEADEDDEDEDDLDDEDLADEADDDEYEDDEDEEEEEPEPAPRRRAPAKKPAAKAAPAKKAAPKATARRVVKRR